LSRQITYSVVADGGTDRALIPIIQWSIHRLDPDVEILEPEFRKRSGSVRDFLRSYATGSMIVFVHRDAEAETLDTRLREFSDLTRKVVPIIPVRMTEAWLLIDGSAIARAADRPSAEISVPPVAQLETLGDPKQELEDRLSEAAGPLTGRRRKQFKASIVSRRVNVANLITDFAPLEALPAFSRFQADLAAVYPYGTS
jgi:hypothetical protein